VINTASPVAVYVTVSATVFVTVKLTTPLASELPLAADMVEVALLSVRLTVLPDTGLLLASFKVTVIVDVVALSATTPVAGEATTVDVDALTAPGVILNAGLVVAVAKLPEVAVNTLSEPTKSILNPLPLKSATPATAFIVTVPPNAPEPVVRLNVTDAVELVTVLPLASCIVTTGCVAKATPDAVLADGCVVKATLLAVPAVPVAVKVKGDPVNPVDVAVIVFDPAVVPKVQLPSVAMPFESVV
jgi:hypothetical protein